MASTVSNRRGRLIRRILVWGVSTLVVVVLLVIYQLNFTAGERKEEPAQGTGNSQVVSPAPSASGSPSPSSGSDDSDKGPENPGHEDKPGENK